MLDNKFRIEALEAHDNFEVFLKKDNDWNTSSKRVLIIIQTVDGSDLHSGEMASTPALPNAIRHAKKIAERYKSSSADGCAFAVSNFNARRHLHLKGQAKGEAESEFRLRQLKLIKKLNPTHILFSGDLSRLYPIDNPHMKNGWVHKIEGRRVVSTLDFGRLMDKNGLYANLLGFWCRHLAHLLLGYHPHDLSKISAKPVVVDTVEKFQKLMKLWDKARRVATDTETRNLSATANKLYTAQFAFDADGVDPEKGYIVIIDHPHADNKISKEDRKYMKKKLRKRLQAHEGPELITFNGMFDLRVYRQCLKIDIIYHTVWEIMAGEHLLDENISSMASIGIKAGGLAAVYSSYGNDFYFNKNTEFSKSERKTIGAISPYDKGLLSYCFPPNALVSTAKGDVAISELQPGDLVWSLNHTTDTSELKPVLNVMQTPARKRMVRLTVDGAPYTMTEDHPVWSDDRKDYVPAGSIIPGERLRMLRKPSNLRSR